MYRHMAVSAAAILAAASTVLALDSGPDTAFAQGMEARQSEAILGLDEALRLAFLSNDPYLQEPELRAAALTEQAIADAQIADPQFRATFANWPTNSFSYTQEPMTQIQLGLSQAFPKGDTLKFSRQKREAQAQAQQALQALRYLEVALDTRHAWLDLYYWTTARKKVVASREAVSEMIDILEAIYATGRKTSQDVLRAQLELDLLDDRLLEIDRRTAMARASLARRIGSAAQRSVSDHLPAMQHPSDFEPLADLLSQHPAVQIQEAHINAAERDVNIASEQYKPGWSVNVGYGARGGDRADFATVGVMMDLPLFTEKRQDKKLSAAKKTHQATRLGRDSVLLDLRKQLDSTYADWQRLQERVTLYQDAVISRAKETSQASLAAYQNGITDFAELIRSRLAELDAELKLLELQTNRLKAQARLLYLEGENDA